VEAIEADAPEEVKGGLPEGEHDSRVPHREALAGAQEEGDARPAPRVNVEPQGRERLRLRSGIDAVLLTVPGHHLAVDAPGGVLAPDNVAGVGGLESVEDLDLGVAQSLGREGDGGLHRSDGEQLEQVVLND